jgi:hypothetical protein
MDIYCLFDDYDHRLVDIFTNLDAAKGEAESYGNLTAKGDTEWRQYGDGWHLYRISYGVSLYSIDKREARDA